LAAEHSYPAGEWGYEILDDGCGVHAHAAAGGDAEENGTTDEHGWTQINSSHFLICAHLCPSVVNFGVCYVTSNDRYDL
jgi:hypothetical protein